MVEQYKGTTTVGIVCKDGVVLAAEKRAAMGYFTISKDAEKILEIEKNMAITIAGTVADGQTLARILKTEAKLFRTRSGRSMSVESMSSLLSNLLFQYKMVPFLSQIILGGVEGDGKARLYSFDPFGGMSTDKYTVTGSGSPAAMAILDDSYSEGKDVKEGAILAARAVSTAIKRDVFSGEGIDILMITKDGIKRLRKEDVEKMVEPDKATKKR